jgi:hypothetical protein
MRCVLSNAYRTILHFAVKYNTCEIIIIIIKERTELPKDIHCSTCSIVLLLAYHTFSINVKYSIKVKWNSLIWCIKIDIVLVLHLWRIELSLWQVFLLKEWSAMIWCYFSMGTPLHSPTVGLLDPLLAIKPQAKRAVCKKKSILYISILRLFLKSI